MLPASARMTVAMRAADRTKCATTFVTSRRCSCFDSGSPSTSYTTIPSTFYFGQIHEPHCTNLGGPEGMRQCGDDFRHDHVWRSGRAVENKLIQRLGVHSSASLLMLAIINGKS